MAYDAEVLADSPVHYWKLDETSGTTATDSGSTPSTGTYNGDLVLGEPGLVGERTCPKFDGVDDYVGLNSGTNLLGSSQQITIELWFKTADVNVAVPTILFEVGGAGRGAAIYVYNGQLYAGITSSSTYQYVTAAVQSNTTYHVVLLVDGPASTIKLYLNASLAGTGSATAPSDWGGNGSGIGGPNYQIRTHIGTAIGTDATYFNGWIDEVALYTTLLSESRIAAHYNAGVGGGGQSIVETIVFSSTHGLSPSATTAAQASAAFSASVGMSGQGGAFGSDQISEGFSISLVPSAVANALDSIGVNAVIADVVAATVKSIESILFAGVHSDAYTDYVYPAGQFIETVVFSAVHQIAAAATATALDTKQFGLAASIAPAVAAAVVESIVNQIISDVAFGGFTVVSERFTASATHSESNNVGVAAAARMTFDLAASVANLVTAAVSDGINLSSIQIVGANETIAGVVAYVPSRRLKIVATPRRVEFSDGRVIKFRRHGNS